MSNRTKQQKRREIAMPPRSYQPSRAELREEYDMPGADLETVREAFFTPVQINEKDRKQKGSLAPMVESPASGATVKRKCDYPI